MSILRVSSDLDYAPIGSSRLVFSKAFTTPLSSGPIIRVVQPITLTSNDPINGDTYRVVVWHRDSAVPVINRYTFYEEDVAHSNNREFINIIQPITSIELLLNPSPSYSVLQIFKMVGGVE